MVGVNLLNFRQGFINYMLMEDVILYVKLISQEKKALYLAGYIYIYIYMYENLYSIN